MKNIPGFKVVPKTGVIYVMTRANQLGFSYENEEWSNLGQGAPEVGHIENSPKRVESIKIDVLHQEYAPVSGIIDLRQKVADYYNELFRKGSTSKYTYENVCISAGGRSSLTRIASALGDINMGHFIPDYTAYEELLSIFKGFIPIPLMLSPLNNYKIPIEELKSKILGMGLSALLVSNPCNPTGQIIKGKELEEWIKLSRKLSCSMIFDEFYSHYIYNPEYPGKTISAAEYVKNVDIDPIIIVDGLTKNWRYPGWRISWILGPKTMIESVSSAGSFLDGGANNPFQRNTLPLLDFEFSLQETKAIQSHFLKKRNYMLERLQKMGIIIEAIPEGTFYFWANLSKLPPPLNNGLTFFEEGLKEKVITVPGIFFDVNPGKRRRYKNANYQSYSRISFGPELEKLIKGLDSLERVINKYK